MTGGVDAAYKALVEPVRKALYLFEEECARAALLHAFHPEQRDNRIEVEVFERLFEFNRMRSPTRIQA